MRTRIISLVIAGLLHVSVYAQNTNPMMNFGLGSLPLKMNGETRSVSAENPTGEKGKGGMAIPDVNNPNLPFGNLAEKLGQGWKVNPFIMIKPGETATLMDVSGSAIIQHIWMVADMNWKSSFRAFILRFYWDDEKEPSVEVPLYDFFAVGHDAFAKVNSLAVVDNPKSALNCYWPMPFRKHAKITITNDGDQKLELFGYQITYTVTKLPRGIEYFHAQWRKEFVEKSNPVYTILDNVKGCGKYAGTFLSWTQLHESLDCEGEVKFYMDGDGKFPTICGTGTEDYFGGSYGFPENYSTLYNGVALTNKDAKAGEPKKFSLYRWHIMDPILFKNDLKVTIQSLALLWNPGYEFTENDIASTAYWYQTEPHNPFPKFPELNKRLP